VLIIWPLNPENPRVAGMSVPVVFCWSSTGQEQLEVGELDGQAQPEAFTAAVLGQVQPATLSAVS
jgi:hypothetical protein